MSKYELSKRIVNKIKDVKTLRQLAARGLHHCYTKEGLWYYLDNGFKDSTLKED